MKTGIFVTARLGSTRLPRKHLQDAQGKPIFQYLLKRIEEGFRDALSNGTVRIVIVTSDEAENRDFEQFAYEWVSVFYGAPLNIPLRHLQAALNGGFTHVVSVDGDDILCSVDGMRRVWSALTDGIPYVKTSGLPFGMNSMGYSREFLACSLEGHHEDALENGWGRIFDESALTEIAIPFKEYEQPLRFTLDYAEDLEFFRGAINALGDSVLTATDLEIAEVVTTRQIYRLNEHIHLEYWNNFRRNVEKEARENES